MDKEAKRIELSALGVHDLRVLARNLRIARPTMKHKEQLIDEIIGVMSGEISSEEDVVKAGRKATVKIFNIQNDEFVIPAQLRQLVEQRKKVLFAFKPNADAIELCQNIQSGLTTFAEKSGYLEQVEGNYYFIDYASEKLVFVNNDIIQNLKLIEYDKVVARCVERMGVDFAVAREIVSVNEQKFYKRKILSGFEDVSASGFAEIDGIHEGKAMYQEGEFTENFDKIISTIQKFKDNGFSVQILGSSVTSMMLSDIEEKIAVENSTIHISENNVWMLERMQLIFKNLIMRACAGEKLLVVMVDYQQMIQDLDECMNKGKEEGYFLDAVRFMKHLNTMCRKLKNGGSISVIGFNK